MSGLPRGTARVLQNVEPVFGERVPGLSDAGTEPDLGRRRAVA
jgi:hypothetical protein